MIRFSQDKNWKMTIEEEEEIKYNRKIEYEILDQEISISSLVIIKINKQEYSKWYHLLVKEEDKDYHIPIYCDYTYRIRDNTKGTLMNERKEIMLKSMYKTIIEFKKYGISLEETKKMLLSLKTESYNIELTITKLIVEKLYNKIEELKKEVEKSNKLTPNILTVQSKIEVRTVQLKFDSSI